jgi:hypothetical protein
MMSSSVGRGLSLALTLSFVGGLALLFLLLLAGLPFLSDLFEF